MIGGKIRNCSKYKRRNVYAPGLASTVEHNGAEVSISSILNLFFPQMHISKIDPSCCLGFYCRDESEFKAFVAQASEYLSPPKLKTSCPLYLIAQGSVRDHKYHAKSTDDQTIAVNVTEVNATPSSSNTLTNESFQDLAKENEQIGNTSDKLTAKKPSKSDRSTFSLTNPKEFLTNFYRQQLSPKSSKNVSLEEEFEIL